MFCQNQRIQAMVQVEHSWFLDNKAWVSLGEGWVMNGSWAGDESQGRRHSSQLGE